MIPGGGYGYGRALGAQGYGYGGAVAEEEHNSGGYEERKRKKPLEYWPDAVIGKYELPEEVVALTTVNADGGVKATEIVSMTALEVDYEIGVLLRKVHRTNEDDALLAILIAAAYC